MVCLAMGHIDNGEMIIPEHHEQAPQAERRVIDRTTKHEDLMHT
jgi:hypothetical protein